jgi:hypothetical protein
VTLAEVESILLLFNFNKEGTHGPYKHPSAETDLWVVFPHGRPVLVFEWLEHASAGRIHRESFAYRRLAAEDLIKEITVRVARRD